MIQIEKPSALDAQKISDVHRQSWHETYDGILPNEKIEDMLNQSEAAQIWHYQEVANGNRSEHFLLVAKDDEKIIGFSDIRFDGEYSEIKALYILREYQRQGIGSLLLQKSLEWAKGSQKTMVDLIIENRPAIRFFERHGFLSTGNMESIGGINITTLVLGK